MRSPFTSDNRPPAEPPAKLDPDQAAYWAIVAERWHPDDDVRDRILVGMLARAEQSTVAPAIREHLIAEARRVLAEHRPNRANRCPACTAKWNGRWPIPYPCWAVKLAWLVAPENSGVAQSEHPDTEETARGT